MTFRSEKWADYFWNGDGNLQLHSGLTNLAKLPPNQEFAAFTLMLAEQVRQNLEQYLEDPSAPVALTPMHLRPAKPIRIQRMD